MYYFIYGFLLLIAFALLFFAIQEFNRTQNLLTNGITTTATVIDLIRSSDSDGDTYSPIFEYYTPQKEKRTYKSEISSSPAPYKIGEQEKIVYDMNDDKNVKTISYWGLYRWAIVMSCIASPLLIIGGGYFLHLLSMK